MSLLRPVILLSVTALLATAQSAAFRWIRPIGGSGGQTIAGLATGYAVTDAVVDVRVDGFSAAGIAAVLGPVAGLPGDVYQISVFVRRPSDFAASNPNLKGFVMPPQVGVNLVVSGAISQAGISLAVGH